MPICRYFKNSKCTKGSNCKYAHPSRCKTFMDNGSAKFNKGGCDGKCGKLHPKNMCMRSLKESKCDRLNCTYIHMKRTKLVAPKTSSNPKSNHQASQNARNPQSTATAAATNIDMSEPFLVLRGLIGTVLSEMTEMRKEMDELKSSRQRYDRHQSRKKWAPNLVVQQNWRYANGIYDMGRMPERLK